MNIIVEVGANRGTDTENFLRDPNNFVFAFEPTPQLYNDLIIKFKNYTNIKIFDYAIDIEEGPSNFNIAGTGDWGCSSLYNFNEKINELWQNRSDFIFTDKCIVNKIRLDSFIKNENIKKIDYLWIDAQGNDFRVLQSLGDKINIVASGKCEGAYTVNLYNNVDNSVTSIKNFLEQNNFMCTIIPDNVNKEADIHFKKL